jgi:hypothetical protein
MAGMAQNRVRLAARRARRLILFARLSLLLLLLAGCSLVPPPPPIAAPVAWEMAAAMTEAEQTLAPARATRYFATTVQLPTYPLEEYQTAAVDPRYRWPYQVFDRERYLAEAPRPELRSYELLVLENDYLHVSILPELGGRIWQVRHKPTGNAMFYQNSVVKPSPWGPANQLGWLGLGGLEWNLPVIEHGYDWGTPWVVTPFKKDDGAVGATIATPEDGRLLAAEITVTLRPGVAYLEIAPVLHNRAETTLYFDYWQTAMLAPGRENRPTAGLHFVMPSPLMTVHSTGDTALPGPHQQFTWPRYFGRDLSRLGNWDQYLGFFEYPAAHGPFTGVYDTGHDAGAVRVYPADVVRGSKVFGLGWRRAIGSEHFTDDGSSYVELHAGLAPTFFEQTSLPAGGQVAWQEIWYPVHGIGDLVAASPQGAINVQPVAGGLEVAVYAPAPLAGVLVVQGESSPVVGIQPVVATELRIAVAAGPDAIFRTTLEGVSLARTHSIHLEDSAGQAVLAYRPDGS